MEGAKHKFGFIVLLRNGRTSPPYELDVGMHNIGSAPDSNIRLRSSNTSLMSTHAVITVNKLGVAIITNKSAAVPITVNGKNVFKTTVLHDGDKFMVVDKEFQYTNESLKNIPAESKIFEQALAKFIKRTSVLPKTPVFKTNTSLRLTPVNQGVQSSTKKSVTNIGHCKSIASRVRKSFPLTSSTKRRVSMQTKKVVVESIIEEKVNNKVVAKSPRAASRNNSIGKPFVFQDSDCSQALDPAQVLNSINEKDDRTSGSDDEFSLHLSDDETPLCEATLFNESTQDRNYNSSDDSSVVVVVNEKRRSSRRRVFEEMTQNFKSPNLSGPALDESTKKFNISQSSGSSRRFSNEGSRVSRRSGILSPIEISSTRESSQDDMLASSSSSRIRSRNSSLNSTASSQSENASPVKSISSQSFSSYKKVSTKAGDTVSETTEIDVVNITSTTIYTPENRNRGNRSKTSSTGKRVSTSMPGERMFDKVLCTSTPFHNEPLNVSLDEQMVVSDSVKAPKVSPPKRRSSLRSSVTKRKHRCFSCGPEESQSVSVLHRHHSMNNINVKDSTPKKSFKDETPKSHVKSIRRLSNANRSTYNPLVEDVTPVTPENIQVSNLNEEDFKTPVNTPGLFESITKSVIRSKKRPRESYGSTTKANKKPKVEEIAIPLQPKAQQKKPLDRFSDFIGVKKLMKSPAKSPKNDLTKVPNLRKMMSPKVQKSPANDLSRNVSGVANLFNVSGVETLQDGSDGIENSEDLFTSLTGKQPIRSYGSRETKSLTTKNESLEGNGKSRKTMGDLPLHSPRVAQWVEEQINMTTEAVNEGYETLDEKSHRSFRRGRSSCIARNKSPDNLNNDVESSYNTSRRRSERNSVSNNRVSTVMSIKKDEGEQSEDDVDFENMDVNESHLEKSNRKSTTPVLNKSLKSRERNQNEEQNSTIKSASRKNELHKSTVYIETQDRKPRVTRGSSSKKKTSLGLKNRKTTDSFEEVSTRFGSGQVNRDQQSSFQSSLMSSFDDASDIANNSQNEIMKENGDLLIDDNKRKSRRVARSISPKKHVLTNSFDRRRTVPEFFQSSLNTNQNQKDNYFVLNNTSTKTDQLQTPDRANLRNVSPIKKTSIKSTSSRTTAGRSCEDTLVNTESAINIHENIENQQSSLNEFSDHDNAEANDYNKTSHEDVSFTGSSINLESNMINNFSDNVELLGRVSDNQTVRTTKTCFSVSPKKRSSNRRNTVAEYPQTACFHHSDDKIASDFEGDSSIRPQNTINVDVGHSGSKSFKMTDIDLKTPVKKPKHSKSVSLKKAIPEKKKKSRRRTVGGFGDVVSNELKFRNFENVTYTNNQQPAVKCCLEDSLMSNDSTNRLQIENDPLVTSNSQELKQNLSSVDDLFSNVFDNNVVNRRRMCRSVSPQKHSLRDSTNRRKTVAQYSQLSVDLDRPGDGSETHVNEDSDSCQQKSDYSGIMANMPLDKPLRRRKGQSLNTRAAQHSFNSHRKTVGAQPKTTPKVKSWKNLHQFTQQSKDIPVISRRATLHFASTSSPVPIKRRQSFADINSKKFVPKVDEWKTETVFITSATSNVNTVSEESTSVATPKKIEKNVPIRLEENQLDLENENAGSAKINKPVDVLKGTIRKRTISKEEKLDLLEIPAKISPKRITRRAKANKKPDVNAESLEPKEILSASDVKSNENDAITPNVLVTQKTKIITRRGRENKTVRENEGTPKDEVVVANQTERNDNTNANVETPHVVQQFSAQDETGSNILKSASIIEVQTPIEFLAGPTEKKTRKRSLIQENIQEMNISVKITSIERRIITATTKRRKLTKDDSRDSAVEVTTLSETAPTTRSTRKLKVVNSPAFTTRATRKQNNVKESEDELEIGENMKSTEGKTKSEAPPTKGRRGRAKKVNSEVDVETDKIEHSTVSGKEENVTEASIPDLTKSKRPTRGRKAVAEKTAEIPIPVEKPVAQADLEPAKAKKSTRRGKVVTEIVAGATVSGEESVAEVELEQVKPKKAARGRKAVTKNIAETPVPVEDLVPEEYLEPVKPKKLTRGRKPKNIAETAEPGEKSAPAEDLELVKSKKATRGRKPVLKNVAETPVPELKDLETVLPKKTTRGKTAVSEDTAPIAEDPVAVEDINLEKPKKATRGKKIVTENLAETVENRIPDREHEMQLKRPTRGRKVVKEAVIAEDTTISAAEPLAAPKQVGKSTRSKRGQKDNTQPDEIEMNEIVASRPNRRGQVNSAESSDPPERQTRSRRGKKLEEVSEKEESEDFHETVTLKSGKGHKNDVPGSKTLVDVSRDKKVTFNENIGVKLMTPRPADQRKVRAQARGNRRNIEDLEALVDEFDDVVFNQPVRTTKRSRRQ